MPLWGGAHGVAVAGGVISTALLEADRNCNSKGPLRSTPFPPPAQTATILSLMSDVDAANQIPKSELMANGVIDPAYVHNQRVRIHAVGDAAGHSLPVLVPDGMAVWVGETVQFIGGHASPNLACAYVPNLIVGP